MASPPLPAAYIAGIARFREESGDRIAIGLEMALDAAALLFLPILTMASLGAAPLAIVAELCALGLILRRGAANLRSLVAPAILLGLLLLWSGLSAVWSIHPLRSLEVAGHLGGLWIGALVLIAAESRLAHPVRLLVCALIGMGISIFLAVIELTTHGVLSGLLYRHHYFPTGMNRGAVASAVLLLPALATAIHLRRPVLGAAAGFGMTAIVYALKATIAKLALPAACVAAGMLLLARGAMVRIAALATILLMLTAPLTFPRLADIPGALDRAYAFKQSLGHRLEIWHFVGDRIAERPLWGWGLDASRAIPGGDQLIRLGEKWLPLHPHNAALQLWLELGLPGCTLFACFAALLWVRLDRVGYPPLFAAAAGGGLFAAMIAAFGSYDIWHEWWIGALSLMLFLVCVMGSVCRDAAREPAGSPARASNTRA